MNLRDWIKTEVNDLGYSFEQLPDITQKQILSMITITLESYFREKMDSPDMRFALRSGISISDFSPRGNPPPVDTCANSVCHVDIGGGCQADAPPGCSEFSIRCLDNGCVYMTSCQNVECTNMLSNCTENFGKVCDNWCVNNDSGCSETAGNCIDMRCTNQSNQGCNDVGNCSDMRCDNRNPTLAMTCGDNSGCSDQVCCNRDCKDEGTGSTSCKDEVCANGKLCTDNSGSAGGSCWDQACLNSGSPGGDSCSDGNCRDKPCVNYNTCADTAFCHDQVCRNPGCHDVSSSTCTDKTCPDNPTCTNGGSCQQ